MDLSGYYKGEITPGQHILTVIVAERYQCHTGTEIFRFTLENEQGQTICQNFPVTKRGRTYLADFAITCGFTREELKGFDKNKLLGKKVIGDVVLNKDGYWAMKAWRSVDEED